MASQKDSVRFTDYLNCRDKAGRLAILTRLRQGGQFLPISLAEDLLCLDIGVDEKLAVLETTGSRDGRALEHFLTESLLTWPQDLATLAVRLWSQRTDHLLWFRILTTLKSPHLSQRISYTIADHAFYTGGGHTLAASVDMEGLEEMSQAFHGLLFHRSVEWNSPKPRLLALAEKTVLDLSTHLHPDNKAMPSALTYLARFAPEAIRDLVVTAKTTEPWRDYLRAVLSQVDQLDKSVERITKFLAKAPKAKGHDKLSALWLPTWARANLPTDLVSSALALVCANEAEPRVATANEIIVTSPWEFFAGIPAPVLVDALAKVTDDAVYSRSLVLVFGLLGVPAPEVLVQQLKERLSKASDPAALLALLPLRLRLELTEGEARPTATPTPFALVKLEEAAVLEGGVAPRKAAFLDYGTPADAGREGSEDPARVTARKAFFDVAYRGGKARTIAGEGLFQSLMDAYQQPTEAKLAGLAQSSRATEGVFRLCYINTLGRFKGHDQAALKILDFVRSKEEDDLRAALHALGDIATPRAAQELVSALTRPNTTQALQLETCAILAKQDLGGLQNELRSAISDLTKRGTTDSGWTEVRDAIASLLNPSQAVRREPLGVGISGGISDQQLDQMLSGKIPNFRDLSSEVKRALRTSQFFHIQVTSDTAPESIDLSPVIDMQYKALELLFRETFEEACSRLIHKGILQRRLDVIGYARPIPRAMDEYENFIASLPIVRDIPFFSKFKLRKMLRAICQFRPGKRFTLDGLKAFALFFLCFSRAECRYGLNGLFPLGFADDKDLMDFCKELHVMQDFRNRAAHEGFHPDASNDIDGIWRATAGIVQNLFKAKNFMERSDAEEFSPRNRSTPIIEKKVS